MVGSIFLLQFLSCYPSRGGALLRPRKLPGSTRLWESLRANAQAQQPVPALSAFILLFSGKCGIVVLRKTSFQEKHSTKL